MSVEGNYQSTRGELSEAEKKIVDYVLNHTQDVLTMSVYELAKAAEQARPLSVEQPSVCNLTAITN